MKQLKRTRSQSPRYSGNAITKSHSIKKNKKMRFYMNLYNKKEQQQSAR